MEMVDARVINIWRKHPSFLDCYALVWNPLSQFEPLSLLPLLSKEFEFIPNEVCTRSWNVQKIINGFYHENVIMIIDTWISSMITNDSTETKLFITQNVIDQLDFVIQDLKKITTRECTTQILEMAIEIQNLAKVWVNLKKKSNPASAISAISEQNSEEAQKNNANTDLKMKDIYTENGNKKRNEKYELMIERMTAKIENKQQTKKMESLGIHEILKANKLEKIMEKLKIIQNVTSRIKSKFPYILDKNLINYNIFRIQNLLVKNSKIYNNLVIDRIYQEIQKWNVLEHLRNYNNSKTNRIYKENLNIHICEYIIANIYKYKKKRRSMSNDLRKEPFRNLINAKKSDDDAKEKINELNNYKIKLMHIAYHGNKEELLSMMEDELYSELDEKDKTLYKRILENKNIK
jgi:hypothetical protein